MSVTPDHLDFIWEMLKKEKIAYRGENDTFKLDNQFLDLFEINWNKNPSNIAKGIKDSVESYIPTSSISESGLVCVFIQGLLSFVSPNLYQKMINQNQTEIKEKEDRANYINELIEKIKMEYENK